ncbi:MAG TPA: hypothetical protein VFG42_10280 [Baekduia sp.]|uniref:hypothetical protein n=1 Tax=Baekduia sp. TaxID=2600305 RepID=UPI002D79038A|nr:hypothetical protein [Baekduia sp.]HET6507168.1 hypothetical protein [Baekduia sp.]
MAQLSHSQLIWRGRIETGLRFAAPVLDLVLAAGDRIARTVDREEPELILPGRLGTDSAALAERTLTDGRG